MTKNATLIISALTAFAIAGGGSVAIAFAATKGVMPDATVWVLAGVLGVVSAAKDVRSQLALPPVTENKQEP